MNNSRICPMSNQIRCIFGLVYIFFVSKNTILAKYIYKLDICIMYCFLFSNLNLLDMLLVMDFLGKIVHLLILKTISKPIFFFYRLLTYKVKKTFSWGFQIYLVLFHICEFMRRPWLTVVKFGLSGLSILSDWNVD